MIKKGGNKGSLRNHRCLYNIGYGSHEESESTQMLHKRKFSKSELRDIVAKATIEAAKEYFESEFGSDEHCGHSFQDVEGKGDRERNASQNPVNVGSPHVSAAAFEYVDPVNRQTQPVRSWNRAQDVTQETGRKIRKAHFFLMRSLTGHPSNGVSSRIRFKRYR